MGFVLVVRNAENDRKRDEGGRLLARNQGTVRVALQKSGGQASRCFCVRVRKWLRRKGMGFVLVVKNGKERGKSEG
jgi:hypothetical protein